MAARLPHTEKYIVERSIKAVFCIIKRRQYNFMAVFFINIFICISTTKQKTIFILLLCLSRGVMKK